MTPIAWVHGALTSFAIALIAMVAQSWPHDEYGEPAMDIGMTCCFGCSEVRFVSACDDYAPAPPPDGAWCGVHLDDRHPLRDASFPVIEVEP